MASGRKSRKDEKLMAEVVNMSWERILSLMKRSGVTNDRKDDVALEIVKRTAPKNIKLDADLTYIPTGEQKKAIEGVLT